MSQTQSLMLTDHPLLIETGYGMAVVAVNSSGGTVYYGGTSSVSASKHDGSITAGSSGTFTENVWVTSAGVATGVTVTTTTIYDEWALIDPSSIGGNVPTGQEFISAVGTPYSNIGWSTRAQSSSDYFGGEIQSDGTQNDEIVMQKYLQAGTYTMDVFTKSGSSHGIISIYVDGTLLGTTIDTYAASGALMVSSITNVQVTGNIAHDIRLVMATKNGSASSYVGILMGIQMTRTGD